MVIDPAHRWRCSGPICCLHRPVTAAFATRCCPSWSALSSTATSWVSIPRLCSPLPKLAASNMRRGIAPEHMRTSRQATHAADFGPSCEASSYLTRQLELADRRCCEFRKRRPSPLTRPAEAIVMMQRRAIHPDQDIFWLLYSGQRRTGWRNGDRYQRFPCCEEPSEA